MLQTNRGLGSLGFQNGLKFGTRVKEIGDWLLPYGSNSSKYYLSLNLQQKQQENEAALKQLSEHLDALDKLEDERLHLALVKGLLAGNVFDWGAQEIRKLLETGNFSFNNAQDKLQGQMNTVGFFSPQNCKGVIFSLQIV